MKTVSGLASVRARHHLRREEDGNEREQKQVQMGEGALLHASVMPSEVVELLAIKADDVVLDATAGMGGHSEAILKAGASRLVALDADPAAVFAARARLERFGARATVIESNFKDVQTVLPGAGVLHIDKALFDLGWNMTQIKNGRGFSFLADEPLNMSYGAVPASGFTAGGIVNTWDEKVLADVFFGYGEERYARRIAKAIVEAREANPIETTAQLVAIIKSAVPAAYLHARLHPATRSFQALRIATNDELGSIEKGVQGAWNLLQGGGRVAVISFHSIEDRVVKRLFASYVKAGEGRLVIKKPLTPGKEEQVLNSSARSAKLRLIEKIC